MLYVVSSLLGLLVLLAAVTASGELIAPLVRGSERSSGAGASSVPVSPWLINFALGCALWIAVTFGLASVRLLQPGLVAGLLALCALVGALLALRRRREGQETASRPVDRDPSSRTRWTPSASLLAVGLLAILIGLWLHALRPDVATDSDVYHLTLPKLYLEHGGFYRVPFSVYSNWPLGLELLFTVAMSIWDHVLAKQLHFALGVMAGLVCFQLARAPGREQPATTPGEGRALEPDRSTLWGLVAAALFLFNPVVLFEIRTAYVDVGQAFFLVIAFGSLHAALDRDDDSAPRLLLLSGICTAVVTASKLNGFFAALCLATLLLVDRRRRGTGAWPQRLGELSMLLLPSLALGLPWLVKSWWLTGNPIYPFVHSALGGPEWSEALGTDFSAWQRAIGMGREAVDYLLLLPRVILFGDLDYQHFGGRLHPAWIVLLPVAVLGARRDTLSRRALLVSGLFFLLWAVSSQQARFLIPILPLLAISAARGLRSLPFQRFVVAIAAAVVMVLLAQASWIYLRQGPRLLADYSRYGGDLAERVVPPVARFVNEELPTEARLLLVNTNRGFFFERPYLADSFFEASQIADALRGASTAGQAHERLLALGTTHVVVDRQDRGIAFPAGFLALLADPELARPVLLSPDQRWMVLELAEGESRAKRVDGELLELVSTGAPLEQDYLRSRSP